KTGSLHQLLHYCWRETVADRFAKIALARQVSSQNASTAKFLHHRSQLVYHLSPIIATNVALVNRPIAPVSFPHCRHVIFARSRDCRKTPTAHGANRAHGTEPAELRGPQRPVCRSTVGAGRISSDQN